MRSRPTGDAGRDARAQRGARGPEARIRGDRPHDQRAWRRARGRRGHTGARRATARRTPRRRPRRRARGQLTLFVGGDEAVLRRVKPVLDTFSRSVVWVGELGAGSVTKLVHNALAMSIDLLLAECLTLGAKAGVAVPRLVEAFRAGNIVSHTMTFTKRMPATLFRGDFAARFALALAYKDFRLAGDLATQHGVPTRLLDLCQMELQEAMNRGWGGQDRIKASTLQEERAGVTLRT